METNKRSTLSSIWGISKIGSTSFLFSILGSSLASFSNFGLNFLNGKIIQVAIAQASMGKFNISTMIWLTVGLFLLMPALMGTQTINLAGGLFAEKRLKTTMIHQILRQREQDIRKNHTGDMMTLLTSDAGVIENFYFQGLSNSFIHPTVAGTASLITTFIVDVRFGIVAVIIGLVSVFLASRQSKGIQDHYVEAREYQNKATTQVSEILSNEEMIRVDSIQDQVVQTYEDINKQYEEEVVSAENGKHIVTLINEFFGVLSKMTFLIIGTFLSMNSGFDFGKVMLLLPLQSSISNMFGNLSSSWNYLLEVSTSANRILDMLEEPMEDQREELPSIELKNILNTPRIVFDDVSFAYKKGQTVLNDLSFSIPAQTTTALVGSSGSGKSTIFQLLLRFYKADTGYIKIDGQKVDDYNLPSIRKQMIYVQQESPLFNQTIKENIRLGASDYDQVRDEDIIEAAKKAAIHDFIMSLPDQYETKVGENANRISGGQRQRIAIARAFMSNAPILLMDEPTSALDSDSEALIQKALDNIRKEKTVLLAAHRLSTIKESDEILVLDKGNIVESGSHNNLMIMKQNYYRFIQKQNAS